VEAREQVDAVREEFGRAAGGFAERTRGRFDELDAVGFSRAAGGETIAEVGAGTGHFLSLFRDVAARLIALDVTPAMLRRAVIDHPEVLPVVTDGAALPLQTRAIDLVLCAQMLHHVPKPIPLVKEMRRVVKPRGRVLVVDQAAPERYEEALRMTELDIVRDPSHAVSRPPSAFRMMLRSTGLEIVDEKIVEKRQLLSGWMWAGEFPEERIAAVRAYIERYGHETGMDFEREGDDWSFTRRRIMILAARSPI